MLMTSNAGQNSDPTQEFIGAIAKDMGLEFVRCTRLSRRRSHLINHYRLESREGKYFVKIARAGNALRPVRLKAILGSPSIERQLAVYDAFSKREFQVFRYPNLIHTDGKNYLVLEYIPGLPPEEHAIDRNNLIAALLELQFAGVKPRLRSLGNLLMHSYLKPTATLLTKGLMRLRRQYGYSLTRRCLTAITKCHAAQGRSEESVLVHNDFHPENILIAESGQLYFTDFENTALTRKWLLVDIVHYAVDTEVADIDVSLIREYLQELAEKYKPFDRLDVRAQLRFALLRRVIQHTTSSAVPHIVQNEYRDFLERVLLSDARYRSWHKANIA